MKKIFLTTSIVLLTVISMVGQKSAIFSSNGKAIRGYDPVSFFSESKAVPGSDTLTYSWQGATWLFSSQANRELFRTSPEKYAPQYGGYCAYGAADGHKAPTETDTWTILNNKLYFNYNKEVRQSWNKNRQALIEKADKQWPEIKDKG